MTLEFIPEEYASLVACEYKKVDKDLTGFYYFLDPDNKQVRILVINPKTYEGIPESCIFTISGQDRTLAICDVTQNQWEHIKRGELNLPDNWSLDSYKELKI